MSMRIKLAAMAVLAGIMTLLSCSTSLDEVEERLDKVEARVAALEKLCSEMNSNISSLKGIVQAVQNGDYITSVTPLTENGKEVGYTINFSKGKPITVYHGKDGKDGSTPNIGVKQDTDGIWYWTLNGGWLLDGNGQKVKAIGTDGKDANTPQLKIQSGYWYVSTDNGKTWTKVEGQDGSTTFKSITVTETEVIFVTADGQTFVLKKAEALSIEFDSADLVVMGTNATREIHYTITSGVDDITIEALSSADIKVKVNRADAKTGSLQVKTGATIDEYSKVVVLVNNGSQAIMRTLTFEEEAIKIEEDTTKEVTDEGGEVTLEFFSNVPCQVVIPEEAQSWISIAPETKAMEKQTIGLIVKPNEGLPRSVTVKVVGNDDTSNIVLSYTIAQEAGGVWKEGTVPPEDEIWYTTTDDNVSHLFDYIRCGDASLVSNEYTNGRGIAHFSGIINSITYKEFGDGWERNKISSLFLPDCVVSIGSDVFKSLGITELRIPESLEAIDSRSFQNSPLKKLTGLGVSDDGHCLIIDGMVSLCALDGIEEYSFPEGIKGIADFACTSNQSLKRIRFPEGIKIIGWEAFSFCPSLAGDIYLPNSLESLGYRVFGDSYGITGYYGNTAFTTSDHRCLISDNWICAFAGRDIEIYTIPEGIVGIDHYGFAGAIHLKKLVFPESMKFVGGHAFIVGREDGNDCLELEEFLGAHVTEDGTGFIRDGVLYCVVPKCEKEYVIPDGVKQLNGQCFVCHNKLERIICNDEIESIGNYAFGWCRNLREVVLPQKVKQFGYEPFAGDWSLEKVYFRSFLPPIYSDTQTGDEFHDGLIIYVPEETIDLYKKSGWYQYAPYMVGYKYDDIGEWNPDYYLSSDYSSDGAVTSLLQSTVGTGIDLIFMGDAFSDRQIADGTYANVMQKAADAFFSEEPYKSMKDRFNVYTVNVVSATEGYEHSGQALSTGHGDGTYVYGNDSKVIEYAKKAISEDRLDDAVIIVMMNEDAYAGTCFMYNPPSGNYGRGLSIAYFPTSSDTDTFNGLVSHEAGGHGFAKLADEYAYEYMGAIASDAIANTKVNEAYGWWKNVDFTSDPELVKWSQFLSDPRYASEGLGCFEGGLTYWTGVWRPTDASIMRYNTGGFNAPSRYAIWYRIGKLAYGESWEGTYEDFVAYDAINRTPAVVARCDAQRRRAVQKPLPQLPPPVVVGNSWREELQKGK